jgi:7-cyano-7-deazaguanine synthase
MNHNTVDVVALLSGGMDSAALAYDLVRTRQKKVHFLSFDYGQRHVVELKSAAWIANELGQRHTVIELAPVARLLHEYSGSALVSEAEVPDGHYAEQTMKQTIVPNRNAMMANIAASIAVAAGAHQIALAVHGGDHYIYPDCRPPFIAHLQKMLTVANDDPSFLVYTPFLRKDKAYIAAYGTEMGVPWNRTWSCYKGFGAKHCGTCGTCNERKEAFILARVPDPTEYLDRSAPAELSAEGKAKLNEMTKGTES